MYLTECAHRRQAAGRLWSEHKGRRDGMQVVSRLAGGLTVIRNLIFTRIHDDVEAKVGIDSMLYPASPLKSALAARVEIELFAIVESTARA